MSDEAPVLELNDGSRIPQLGFGVFMIDEGDTR
jgi:diketogulonate reductase-like aldo/keto reductase